MTARAHQPQLDICPLREAVEAEWCARLMSTSEPWITLGRTYEKSLASVRNAMREVYIARAARQQANAPVAGAGELCGFLILSMQGVFVGYIQTVCVAPEWRGSGLGTRLVRWAEQRIFRDSPNVFLCVSSFNSGARRLYERLGYEVVGELCGYFVPEHSEVLLRKTTGSLRDFHARKEPA